MITYSDAFSADEFHIGHGELPCVVWRRDGQTQILPAQLGQYRVPLVAYDAAGSLICYAITSVNAGDFHTLADCPHARSDRSEVPPAAPAAAYDADGYDADGYDADGYDQYGYDADGYDEDGYNEDGYNEAGYNEAGYDADGYDEGYDRDGNHYSNCERCERQTDDDDLTSTLADDLICERCRDNYYSYCDDCEGWYHDGDAEDHEHEEDASSGCCDSPQLRFTIRNDGCEPLANDTRVTVSLPAGTISAEGLQEIRYYLQNQSLYDLSYDMDRLGDQWQQKDGNFAKRLSRLAYQRHQPKVTQEVMSQVGNIARDHSKPVDVRIEVTRELNMSASAFWYEDSCWWQSYSYSRCTLKTNGGLGLRSFDEYGNVSGRAWIFPLRLTESGGLTPTFDTMTPDAFVVFNGYGDLEGYAPARVIAHMAGWTYRKISFDCSPIYVNSGGYLIGPEQVVAPYTDGRLDLSLDQHSRLFKTETELVNA